MRVERRWHSRAIGAVALLAVVVGGAPVGAQSSGFLLGRPSGSITLRGGLSQARASGDLFDDLSRDLTIGRGDFAGVQLGGELAFTLAPAVDLTVDGGYLRASAGSHYRDLVDLDNREIEQTTSLERAPLTANVKLFLTSRGRSIGRFAWIPEHVTPWVGAGGGMMWYRFRQTGDFVNPTTFAVYSDELLSDGWTPMAQAMAGVDVSLTPRLALTGDARYLMVKRAGLNSRYFGGYDPIDLSGAAVSLGLTVRL